MRVPVEGTCSMSARIKELSWTSARGEAVELLPRQLFWFYVQLEIVAGSCKCWYISFVHFIVELFATKKSPQNWAQMRVRNWWSWSGPLELVSLNTFSPSAYREVHVSWWAYRTKWYCRILNVVALKVIELRINCIKPDATVLERTEFASITTPKPTPLPHVS